MDNIIFVNILSRAITIPYKHDGPSYAISVYHQ